MKATTLTAPRKPSHTGPETELSSRHAVFRRRGQFFGLSIDLVREVLPGQPLTRVPRAHDEILGVLSLRGEILPVVVIDGWLGLTPEPDDATQPILVLRRGELLVGLRVDAIQGVANIPMSQVQPHPVAGNETHLTGIWHPPGGTPITLIAGEELLQTLCQNTSVNA